VLKVTFALLGKLPLPINHAMGVILGLAAWLLSSRHRRLTRQHLNWYGVFSGKATDAQFERRVIGEQGKGITELVMAWTAPVERLYGLIQGVTGWENVEAAQSQRRAMIFVTPHLGCFDIAGRYLESRVPITALYRPPKQAWLEPIMQQGRARGGAKTAAADASGVRSLLKTLKAGGATMILPDQVPSPEQGGDGAWADFIGHPAFTMTLLPRLAHSANALVFFFFAERLPHGAGYVVHFVPMEEPYSVDKTIAARQTNAMVEKLIAMAPEQYLWGYNRFKRPAGAPTAPGSE
jgi:KDO2-lipid IV(A) lauroyltransferase